MDKKTKKQRLKEWQEYCDKLIERNGGMKTQPVKKRRSLLAAIKRWFNMV